MLAVQTINLTKRFKDVVAVDSISFGIEEGVFFAFLGLNGAGKTTTIKMLSGLLEPTNGDAYLLGDSIITNLDLVKQKINVSPQETAIAPNLTVFENLVFIARIYGQSKQTAEIKAHEMMNIFGLSEIANDKTKKLSGGFKRRLSIAMALISNPKVLFLDEPTLGLDIRSRKELWKTLSSLKGKVTVVLTTHYLDEVEALADYVGIIDSGKIKALGSIAELKQQTKLEKLEDIFLSFVEEDELI